MDFSVVISANYKDLVLGNSASFNRTSKLLMLVFAGYYIFIIFVVTLGIELAILIKNNQISLYP